VTWQVTHGLSQFSTSYPIRILQIAINPGLLLQTFATGCRILGSRARSQVSQNRWKNPGVLAKAVGLHTSTWIHMRHFRYVIVGHKAATVCYKLL
jgi:hypothetical protein